MARNPVCPVRLCLIAALCLGSLCYLALCDIRTGGGSCFAAPERSLRSIFFPDAKEKISIVPIPDEVRFEELSRGLQKGKWTLIDCRNETELEDPGMIPGSYNIPLHDATAAFKLTEAEFVKKYGFRKPDPGNDRVAVSCRSGKRAEEFLDKIRTMGYSNFKLYKGSFLDWVDRGGEVISMKKRRDL